MTTSRGCFTAAAQAKGSGGRTSTTHGADTAESVKESVGRRKEPVISETFNFIALIAEAIILIAIIIYVDIIMEEAAEIREIAQSYGWADMDKVRALDKKKYVPAERTMSEDAYFTMPDGERIHRCASKRRRRW